MLPAPLKKLAIRDIAPVTADRMYFLFHLRSGDSQKASTVALWTRGDKKPFPSVKLGHYAQAICVLPDGRLVATADRSSVLDGLTPSHFDTPCIEDVTWCTAWVIEGKLVIGGSWGALQRHDPSGAWTDLSKCFDNEVNALASHPRGGFVVAGAHGLLAHLTPGEGAGQVAPIHHELGTDSILAVHCRADGTVIAAAERKLLVGETVVPHPGRGSFSCLASAGGQVFVSATDGLRRVHDDAKLETITCPVAPSPLSGVSLRAVGDALIAFDDDAAHIMRAGDWARLA